MSARRLALTQAGGFPLPFLPSSFLPSFSFPPSFLPSFMQDKRRRNDFASTEVGEVKGGRVTQQAFDEKDSGISNAAMPGTRGDGRKDAQENAAP